MNAEQARILSARNLQTVVVGPLLYHIYTRIQKAAEKGEVSIAHPFHGVTPYPDVRTQDAVWKVLIEQGYDILHQPNPDPADPRSSAWDEVSWAGGIRK